MFAEAAFLSHLLLDDIAEGGLSYLYPLHNEPLSVFSYMDVGFSDVNSLYYNLAGMVSVFFMFCVLLISLMSLHYLGFDFRYQPPGAKVTETKTLHNKINIIYGCSSKSIGPTDVTNNEK